MSAMSSSATANSTFSLPYDHSSSRNSSRTFDDPDTAPLSQCSTAELRARVRRSRSTTAGGAVAVAVAGPSAIRHALLQEQLAATRREVDGLHALNEVLVGKQAKGAQALAQQAHTQRLLEQRTAAAERARAKVEAARMADQHVHAAICERAAAAEAGVVLAQQRAAELEAQLASASVRLVDQAKTIHGLENTKHSLQELYETVGFEKVSFF